MKINLKKEKPKYIKITKEDLQKELNIVRYLILKNLGSYTVSMCLQYLEVYMLLRLCAYERLFICLCMCTIVYERFCMLLYLPSCFCVLSTKISN